MSKDVCRHSGGRRPAPVLEPGILESWSPPPTVLHTQQASTETSRAGRSAGKVPGYQHLALICGELFLLPGSFGPRRSPWKQTARSRRPCFPSGNRYSARAALPSQRGPGVCLCVRLSEPHICGGCCQRTLGLHALTRPAVCERHCL